MAKNSLFYSTVTVFAPEDDAFDAFNGKLTTQLTDYHVTYEVVTFSNFTYNAKKLETIQESYPPLWVKKNHEDELYVNNALVVQRSSNYISKSKFDGFGKTQVLHIVDEVLDPIVEITSPPTAYDVMLEPYLWTTRYALTKFLTKVHEARLDFLFAEKTPHTFFVPIDEAIDQHRSDKIDSYVVKAHVVKCDVMFVRPSRKGFFYETMTNDDYIYVMVALFEENGATYVKSTTVLGDINHETGDVKAKIVVGNIPVANGVVHLIDRPLAVFDRKLTKFPFLTVWDKFSADPELNTSYSLAVSSGLDQFFHISKKLTLFVPNDRAWRKSRLNSSKLMQHKHKALARSILGRHVIVSDVPLMIETLRRSSKENCIELATLSGKLCVKVEKRGSEYVMWWNGKWSGMYRVNYECSDGVVHVIDSPLLTGDDYREVEEKPLSFVKIWKALNNMFMF